MAVATVGGHLSFPFVDYPHGLGLCCLEAAPRLRFTMSTTVLLFKRLDCFDKVRQLAGGFSGCDAT